MDVTIAAPDDYTIVLTVNGVAAHHRLLGMVARTIVDNNRSFAAVRPGRAEFRSEAARTAERTGYGDESYWRHLEASALAQGARFPDQVDYFLTRSLGEAVTQPMWSN